MDTGILEVLLVNAEGIKHTNLVGILPFSLLYMALTCQIQYSLPFKIIIVLQKKIILYYLSFFNFNIELNIIPILSLSLLIVTFLSLLLPPL